MRLELSAALLHLVIAVSDHLGWDFGIVDSISLGTIVLAPQRDLRPAGLICECSSDRRRGTCYVHARDAEDQHHRNARASGAVHRGAADPIGRKAQESTEATVENA